MHFTLFTSQTCWTLRSWYSLSDIEFFKLVLIIIFFLVHSILQCTLIYFIIYLTFESSIFCCASSKFIIIFFFITLALQLVTFPILSSITPHLIYHLSLLGHSFGRHRCHRGCKVHIYLRVFLAYYFVSTLDHCARGLLGHCVALRSWELHVS
jgi:hypothetical protein